VPVKIILREFGGLGNQLFQYAAGRYYARRYNAELAIAADPAWNAQCNGYPRPCMLQHFSVRAKLEERTLTDRISLTDKPWLRVAASPMFRLRRVALFTEQPAQQYIFLTDLPRIEGVRTLYLQGYFQTHALVASVAEELREEFRFREPAAESCRPILDQICGSANAVSLHIRRGDAMLPWEGKAIASADYYEHAVAQMRERLPDPKFFVFSDDMAAARAMLPRDLPLVFVEHNDDFNAHEDLRLMATCRHHILANSTFSWWGAWLNPSQEKLVMAPRHWFLAQEARHANLLPPDWILLDPARDRTSEYSLTSQG
jgi:hypothetical protein